jgi:hypothetical protein
MKLAIYMPPALEAKMRGYKNVTHQNLSAFTQAAIIEYMENHPLPVKTAGTAKQIDRKQIDGFFKQHLYVSNIQDYEGFIDGLMDIVNDK